MISLRFAAALVLMLTLGTCDTGGQPLRGALNSKFAFKWQADTLTAQYAPLWQSTGTFQTAIAGGFDITGDGKGEFFTSISSLSGFTIWRFFGFRPNLAGGYDMFFDYAHPGMSNSLEANQKTIAVGDWNNDSKSELILGVDPEQKDSVNLLVFEPSGGIIPGTPTAKLLTPKVSRFFGTAIGTQQRWSWEDKSFVADMDGDGTKEFVGIGLLGVLVGRYGGSWSDPNAPDNIQFVYVDSMINSGVIISDIDGNGKKEVFNATAFTTGPAWSPDSTRNDLPGTYHRKDYFTITEAKGTNSYQRSKVMAWLADSLRRVNGYPMLPANFGGCRHNVMAYDIDADGKDEIFMFDSYDGARGRRLWMVDIGTKSIANLDSTDFTELLNLRDISVGTGTLTAGGAALADMDNDGKIEIYAGSTTAVGIIFRVNFLGGNPKTKTNWQPEVIYQDSLSNVRFGEVLIGNDMDGNGKKELVFINRNFHLSKRGGAVVILEPVQVNAVEDNILPKAYALEQNYPNPFNPVTRIRYAVPAPGQVLLRVFNTLGEDVATLVDERKEVGFHEVQFDAGRLSSGVYFYRMEMGGFTAVRKMTLVR